MLLRKERTYAEIYNDLDNEVVNVFKQFRTRGKEIERRLRLTPFSRDEYYRAYDPAKTDLDRAIKTIIKSYMGFGSDAIVRKSGFRHNSNRSGTTPAHDWVNYPDKIDFFIERFKGVVIENRDAVKVLLDHDAPTTLHYVDPPYVHSTRTTNKGYKFEMTDQDHRDLFKVLKSLKGRVIVSGYNSPLYNELYSDWHRVEKEVATFNGSSNSKKVREILWMNFKKPALK